MLEGVAPSWWVPNDNSLTDTEKAKLLRSGLEHRFNLMDSHVNQDVEMGYHICYGDYGHKHFVEPKDTANIVKLANILHESANRRIDWVHLPVPIDRKDDRYFKPLNDLGLRKNGETELYLGLVHAYDVDGTQERIRVADRVLGGRCYGVATECGWGRMEEREFCSMLEVSRQAAGILSSSITHGNLA